MVEEGGQGVDPTMMSDLLDPSAFPDSTTQVSLIQTHISMVFLTDSIAYKIKKPVNFGFLDFSTLQKRAFYCFQEVTLNKRLAEDIYIEVVPIFFDGKHYSLATKKGEIIEYAVKMKRIPDEKLMSSLFKNAELTPEHLKDLARVLGTFHLTGHRAPEISQYGSAEKFKINTDENFMQVEPYIGVTIKKEHFLALQNWTESFYKDKHSFFHERIKNSKILDCHGDLHMDHVCFTEKVSIIDCIEFNERFRYSDSLADIAFLLMDLEYHGGRKHSEILWDEYSKGAKEQEDIEPLLVFYKVYRAFVRGKVLSFQVDDKNITKEKKEEAVHQAQAYFLLALSYIK